MIIEYAKDEGIELTLNRKGEISSKFLIGTIRYEFYLDYNYTTQTTNGKRYYPNLITNEDYWIILNQISPEKVDEAIKKELDLEEKNQDSKPEEGENTSQNA